MKKPPLGDQELDVLRFVAEHAPISVRDVSDEFGDKHGLARTTILTVMERLRAKGYLVRRKEDGVFRYRPLIAQAEVMRNLVEQFIERTLGGSLTPFVAYLADSGTLTSEEMEQLRRIVESLHEEGQEGAGS